MAVMTKPVRLVFACPPELRQEIIDWRRAQPDLPSESRAIVELLRMALEAWRKQQAATKRRRL